MNLDQTKRRIETIENLQREIREAKEMLKEELEAEPAFREVVDEANEVNTKKKRLKEELENRGSNKKLLETIKSNTEEISTLREILSAELIEVYTEQKVDEITDINGDIRKFKLNVRLLGRGASKGNRDQFGKYTPGENPVSE